MYIYIYIYIYIYGVWTAGRPLPGRVELRGERRADALPRRSRQTAVPRSRFEFGSRCSRFLRDPASTPLHPCRPPRSHTTAICKSVPHIFHSQARRWRCAASRTSGERQGQVGNGWRRALQGKTTSQVCDVLILWQGFGNDV